MISRKHRGVLIVLGLALAGCGAFRTPSATPAVVQEIKVVDEMQVTRCTRLKDIVRKEGWSYGVLGMVSGVYAQQGLEAARADVLREAKAQGATHIAWMPKAEGAQVGAKAYRCDAQNPAR